MNEGNTQTRHPKRSMHHERAIETATVGPHPGVDTDSRCFPLWLGRTVPSPGVNTGALAEAHTDGGCGLDDLVGTGMRAFLDIPSRSVNSAFTSAKERRSSAHCACVQKGNVRGPCQSRAIAKSYYD